MNSQLINSTDTSFKQSVLISAELASEVQGVDTISGCAVAIIDFIGALFGELSIELGEFYQKLQNCSSISSFFSFFYYIKWWGCPDKSESWQYTASMVCSTAQQCLSMGDFLESVSAISLSKISANIGRIPVLGLVSSVLSLSGSCFSFWHDALQERKLKAECQEIEQELEKAREECRECHQECAQITSSIGFGNCYLRIQKFVSKVEKEQLRKIFPTDAEGEDKLKIYAQKSLASRVTRLEVELKNSTLDRKKNWISLANDVSSIVLGILVLVGLCAGIASLYTGLPIITLGLIAAGMGLYEYLYDKWNLATEAPEVPCLVAAVQQLVDLQNDPVFDYSV